MKFDNYDPALVRNRQAERLTSLGSLLMRVAISTDNAIASAQDVSKHEALFAQAQEVQGQMAAVTAGAGDEIRLDDAFSSLEHAVSAVIPA